MDMYQRIAKGEFKNPTSYLGRGRTSDDKKAWITAYNQGEQESLAKFKQAAFKELGIEDNYKKELLYSHAYDLGHADGMPSIYDWMEKLVDLIQD